MSVCAVVLSSTAVPDFAARQDNETPTLPSIVSSSVHSCTAATGYPHRHTTSISLIGSLT